MDTAPRTVTSYSGNSALATSDAELLQKLKDYSKNLKEQVQAKDAKLQEVGYKAYMK